MFRYILMLSIVLSCACGSSSNSGGPSSGGVTTASSCGNSYTVSINAAAPSSVQSVQSVFALLAANYPGVMVDLVQSTGSTMSIAMTTSLSSWTFNTSTGSSGATNIPPTNMTQFLNTMTAIPGVTLNCSVPSKPYPGVTGGT